jgi:hypothetical protein
MMVQAEQEPTRNIVRTLFAEVRSIWSNALAIFRRDFDRLNAELVVATWRRFFLTITMTILLGIGLHYLLLGLFYKIVYEPVFRIRFNLVGYWLMNSGWGSVNAALFDIPFVLLVAYLSYNWIPHTKEENSHWVQEAQMIAITWTVTSVCNHILLSLSLILVIFITRDLRTFSLRTNLQNGSLTILNYLFFGLVPVPITAYRYNLRLHGNKILNGLTGRDRWLLLGFQFVMLEGATLFFGQLVFHLPIIQKLYESLIRLSL